MAVTGVLPTPIVKPKAAKQPNVRLFQPAVALGYRRSRKTTLPHTSLLQIKDVTSTQDAKFYLGKRVAYIYKGLKKVAHIRSAKNVKRQSRLRVIWGRVTRPHGNSGVVRAKFAHNLPTHSVGRRVRVYLYPSSI